MTPQAEHPASIAAAARCPSCLGLWVQVPEKPDFNDAYQLLLRKLSQRADLPASTRSCPDCAQALSRTTLQGVAIDLCTRCRGVFYDLREFETVLGKTAVSQSRARRAARRAEARGKIQLDPRLHRVAETAAHATGFGPVWDLIERAALVPQDGIDLQAQLQMSAAAPSFGARRHDESRHLSEAQTMARWRRHSAIRRATAVAGLGGTAGLVAVLTHAAEPSLLGIPTNPLAAVCFFTSLFAWVVFLYLRRCPNCGTMQPLVLHEQAEGEDAGILACVACDMRLGGRRRRKTPRR